MFPLPLYCQRAPLIPRSFFSKNPQALMEPRTYPFFGQGMCYWHEIALKPKLKIPFVLLRSLVKGLGSQRMACEHVPPFAGGAMDSQKGQKIVGVHGYTGSMLALVICGHDGCG